MVYKIFSTIDIIEHIKMFIKKDWQRVKLVFNAIIDKWKTEMSEEEYKEFYEKYKEFIDFLIFAKSRKKRNRDELIKEYFKFMDEDERLRFLNELIGHSSIPLKLKIVYKAQINKNSPFLTSDLENVEKLEKLFKFLRYL